MNPCKGCERCVTIHHDLGQYVEYVCVCSGRHYCKNCNRVDVAPKLVKRVRP